MKRYFYITVHFSPDYEKSFFSKQQGNLYINNETREVYCKRPLYDFGWGQEDGFELMPQLPFDKLIKLVEQPMASTKERFLKNYTKEEFLQADIWRSNLYGAIAVIMQDYVEELIGFLSTKVDTGYFQNSAIRDNFKCFSFDSQKTRMMGKVPGEVKTRSYEEILGDYPRRRKISASIIDQVHR